MFKSLIHRHPSIIDVVVARELSVSFFDTSY